MASEGTSERLLALGETDPVTVAGYRLNARLGSGGMGKVYLSYTPGGRPVAIKVIRPEFSEDPEFRRRFQREVQAAQRVQGLYTAPVIDYDTEGDAPWLATAYVPGPALTSAVAEHGPMPVPTVLLLVAGIAEALQAIHGAGIVHRDLKPSNVLLASDGPRVIDFGIAHAADGTALTSSGVAIGTPSFMSPEQAAGEAVTEATDVFALGQVAAYAALGAPAFGEGPSHAVLYRIVHNEPSLDGLPDALNPLVTRCLAKDPADRPSVAEVIGMCQEASESGQLVRPEDWLPGALAADVAATTAAPGPVPGTDTPPPAPATPPPPATPPVTTPVTETAPTPPGTPQQPSTPPPPRTPAPPGGLAGAPTMHATPPPSGPGPVPGPYAGPHPGPASVPPHGPGFRPPAPGPVPGPFPRPYVQPKRNRGKIMAIVFGGVIGSFWLLIGLGAILEENDSGTGASGSSSSSSGEGGAERADRPAPKPATYKDIDVPASYELRFADRPPKPLNDDDGDEGEFYYDGDNDEISADQAKFVLLNNAQKGSLRTCKSETRFAESVGTAQISPGSRICVTTDSGHIALVTVKGFAPESDPSDFVTVDVTVWRNAIEPKEDDGF